MKNISKTLLLTAAMGLGLMAPGIPSAKATDSCNTTTAAQPVVIYDPFVAMQADMMRMNMEMSRMMQTAFSAASNPGAGANYSSFALETTPKEYRITMTAPGKDEKDLKVSVNAEHTLTIQSQKDLVQKTSTGQTEHSIGSFTQMMSLPADADIHHMQTSYKDGKYTVTVPRKANAASTLQQSEHGLST